MPTSPPHVRLPTSGPSLACLKSHGSASPGTGNLVGNHHLRPVDGCIRRVLDGPVAGRPVGLDVPSQYLDEIIGDLPAPVESLIDNRALLLSLRKEVAIEVGKTACGCVGQIDVCELAAG